MDVLSANFLSSYFKYLKFIEKKIEVKALIFLKIINNFYLRTRSVRAKNGEFVRYVRWVS